MLMVIVIEPSGLSVILASLLFMDSFSKKACSGSIQTVTSVGWSSTAMPNGSRIFERSLNSSGVVVSWNMLTSLMRETAWTTLCSK